MTANSKSNTLAIKPKTKGIPKKKELINKIQKLNSKSIAKAIKSNKKENCESNTSAISTKTKETCKSIAKVLPENNVTDIQLTPQLKQNIVNIAQAAPGLMEMLEWYHKKHKNVIEIPELKINSKLLGSVVITKTFKISEKAIKKFIEFAEKHPHLKHQDLMGMALIEFVEKYHNF